MRTPLRIDTMKKIQRKIRSFVRREGRLTPGQQRALTELWPLYGIELSDQPLVFNTIFGNNNPVTLEIGFGNGESLVTMAAAAPERNFLGIEVHRPGVGNMLIQSQRQELSNIRVMREDAVDILSTMIPDQSLDCVQIFFPDPWHKKRHNKRRLIQTEFMHLLARKQPIAATLHFATDWQDYAEHTIEIIEHDQSYRQVTAATDYHRRPAFRPETKFERRGQKLGHKIWDIIYQRDA